MFVKNNQILLIKIVLETHSPLNIDVIMYFPGSKLIFKLAVPVALVVLVYIIPLILKVTL